MDDTVERDRAPQAWGPALTPVAAGAASDPLRTRGSEESPALYLAETRDSGEQAVLDRARPAGGDRIQTGERVGRYITVSRLGVGGMGVVLAAYDPELDRKVALKLLRTPGQASPHAQLRLQREAQALAKLNHRNVVSVHDVGLHQGQLFVAMEFVDGVTLHEWMHGIEAPRPWREVLGVLLEAGRGLAAAHAVGLVHRDFKPDNVMLGSDGCVRVMDFGIARASQAAAPAPEMIQERAEAGLMVAALRSPIGRLTCDGTIIGTPAYMSREQLLGAEVDARSDQFSFCVTLYEALYGAPPFSGETLEEMIASIKEGAPREPSGAPRVPGWLRQALVRGLASSPEERWPSMGALLEVLADDPDLRRRRRLMTAGLVGVLGAGAAAAGTLAASEQGVCSGMEEQLEGVWDEGRQGVVEEALLGTKTPYASDTWGLIKKRLDDYTDAWVSAREGICESTRTGEQSARLLDLRMACLDERLHYVRATVDELARVDETTVEDAVRVIAKLPGLEACSRAEVLADEPLLPAAPEVAQQVAELNRTLITARTKVSAGRYDESLTVVEEVVAGATELDYEPLLVRAWFLRGVNHDRDGHYAEAVADLERSLESALALNMRDESAEAATELVFVVGYHKAEVDQAQRWISLARALSRASDSRRFRVRYLTHTGTVAYAGGEYEEARGLWEEALELLERPPASDSLDLLPILGNLGVLARLQGHYAAAREYHMRVLSITERELGSEHPEMAETLNDLAAVSKSEGNVAEAREYLERALAIGTRALGPDHPRLAGILSNLSLAASAELRFAEARGYLERVLAIDERTLGPDHPDLAIGLNNLGKVALSEGKHEEAREHFTRALTIREKALGPEHPGLIYALANLGELAQLTGDGELALQNFGRASVIAGKALEADDPLAAKLSTSFGLALVEEGDPKAAIEHLERALKVQGEGEVGEVELAETRFATARALWELPAGAGRDRGRALALAKLALPAWEADGERSAEKLERLRAWLGEHTDLDE